MLIRARMHIEIIYWVILVKFMLNRIIIHGQGPILPIHTRMNVGICHIRPLSSTLHREHMKSKSMTNITFSFSY